MQPKFIHVLRALSLGGLTVVLIILATFSGTPQAAHAQEPVVLDENKLGEISPTNPQPVYLFVAQGSQEVEIEVLAIAQGMAPHFTVFNDAGALVTAIGNPTLTNTLIGVVTFPQAGTYSIQVASANGVQGQFVLTIRSAVPTVPPTPLRENEAATGELPTGQNIVYSFSANPNALLNLELGGTNSTVSVHAELKDSTGKVIAVLGSELLGSTLQLAPGSTTFLLELKNDQPASEPIAYQVLLTPVDINQQAGGDGGQAVVLPTLPTTGACVLATRNNTQVNVRAEPSPDANIIARIAPTETYGVLGRSADNSFYRINYGGGEGWVAASVTRTGGVCSGLAVLGGQPSPNATEQATQQATQPVNPNATEQATQSATEQATQPPLTGNPAAPSDNDYAVTLDRNGNAQFSEQVSYPDGDHSDGINFSVGNFDSVTTFVTYTFAMACSGDNAGALSWGIGGGGLTCGGSTSINFTTDSNNTRISVFLPDGSNPGLVNYTLTIIKQ